MRGRCDQIGFEWKTAWVYVCMTLSLSVIGERYRVSGYIKPPFDDPSPYPPSYPTKTTLPTLAPNGLLQFPHPGHRDPRSARMLIQSTTATRFRGPPPRASA
jgi:hypothetical protein